MKNNEFCGSRMYCDDRGGGERDFDCGNPFIYLYIHFYRSLTIYRD